MSLLMEALKKAEEAKRQAAQADKPTAVEPTLVPLDPAPVANPEPPASASTAATEPVAPVSPLPDLAQHIAAVDADLAAVSTETPLRRRPAQPPQAAEHPDPGVEAARGAARNAFAAKQPVSPRRTLWWLGGFAVLATLAIVGYFGWQLQGISSPRPVPPTARAAPIVPPPPAPPQPAGDRPAPPLPEHAIAESSPVNAAPPPPPTTASRQPVTPPTPAARASRARTAQPAGDEASTPPLRLSRGQPEINPRLERAFAALQGGRLDEAAAGYGEVLKSDPRNTDALLGLATIARRQGQGEAAAAYYQRVLETDPNEPTALAATVSGRAQADPAQAESRLKIALAAQPGAPSLHFALGNLYARQGRWADAQQAYFHAYSNDAENADYIFNLAVSLDHLRQARLAAQYYQLALDAAEAPNAARTPSFAKEKVRQRILELRP